MREDLTAFYLLGAVVALLIGADKGGVGGMLGILGVPIMSQIIPVNEAIAVILPMLIFGDLFAISSHWKHWNSALLPRLLPGGVLGVLVGTFVLVNISPQSLRIALAVVIFVFFVYRLVEQRIIGKFLYQPRSWHGILGGAAAGLTSTIAHAGGPPITIYLLLQKLQPRMFVATAAVFFATINLFKLPFYAAAGLFTEARLLSVIWLLPLVPVGVWLGRHLATRVPRLAFERLVGVLLLLAAGLMLRS